jgi:hypothetical protein
MHLDHLNFVPVREIIGFEQGMFYAVQVCCQCESSSPLTIVLSSGCV